MLRYFFHMQPFFTDILHSSMKPNFSRFALFCSVTLLSMVLTDIIFLLSFSNLHEGESAILRTMSWTIHPAISCQIYLHQKLHVFNSALKHKHCHNKRLWKYMYQEVQYLCLPSLLSFLPVFPPKGHPQLAPSIFAEAW